MRAVLVFSALLHVAVIGGLAAFALRSWLNANRPKEPSVPEFVMAAAALAVAVALAGTIVTWTGRPFGAALTTGIAAGVLSGVAFIVTLGTLPHARPGFAEPPSQYVRLAGFGLVGVVLLTEVVAFCFLVSTASKMAVWS